MTGPETFRRSRLWSRRDPSNRSVKPSNRSVKHPNIIYTQGEPVVPQKPIQYPCPSGQAWVRHTRAAARANEQALHKADGNPDLVVWKSPVDFCSNPEACYEANLAARRDRYPEPAPKKSRRVAACPSYTAWKRHLATVGYRRKQGKPVRVELLCDCPDACRSEYNAEFRRRGYKRAPKTISRPLTVDEALTTATVGVTVSDG